MASEISRRGGLAATHELLTCGYTSRQLSAAVAGGRLIRVRQGWYTAPGTAEIHQQAVRVGGRLTCVSAARMLGLMVREPAELHIAVVPTSSRLRDTANKSARLVRGRPPGVIVHWTDRPAGLQRLQRLPLDAMLDMAVCQSPEVTIAAVDSAIRLGSVALLEWLECTNTLPPRLAVLLAAVDGRSESITESIARVRLRGLGLEPRLQVQITGVGRVDMLVGTRLVLELDGWKYHSDLAAFESDRSRDAKLSVRGFRVLRFSYHQIMNNWSEVKAAVLAAVARGDHLA